MNDDTPFYSGMIDRCRDCDGDITRRISPEGTTDEDDLRCLLCDRYFRQGRLFLNNVG